MSKTDYTIIVHKYLSGQISRDEEALLRDWLAQDQANRDMFDELKEVWDASDDYDLTDPEMEAGLVELERRIQQSRKQRRVSRVLIVALSLAVVALIAWDLSPAQDSTTVTVSNVDDPVMVFPDSSTVTLNARTTVEFRSHARAREAVLSGEAVFHVKTHEAPFVIRGRDETLDFRAEMLGTTVMVSAYPGKPVTVFVVEGKVKVSYREEEAMLQSGESCVLTDSGIERPSPTNPNLDAWYTRKLEFRDTALRDVLDVVTKVYRVEFQVSNPDLLSCRFTGTFSDATLEHILEVLSFVFDAEFNPRGTRSYEVSGRGCR